MYVDHIIIVACGLNLIGALVLLLADAWLSRSMLVYLDALEENLMKTIEMLQKGEKQFQNLGFDVKRDRNQNRARFIKNVGWVIMIAGFALQLATLIFGIS